MIYLSKKHKNALNKLKNTLFVKLVFLLIIISYTTSNLGCANMQRPTGGPKDTIPPKVLNIEPENFQTNFKEKEIILEFDEFIKLNNQFREFSISPDTDLPPNYKVKKKRLHITLPDSLAENTTYQLNFGKGIVDYNEGNPLENFVYVFSTGDILDSLSISGRVQDGFLKEFDYQNDKEVRVILIPTSQDSIFGKRKANIFATVDSSGNFKISHLKEDTYRIYALKEENNNRIYDSPSEYIGFLKDSITLNNDTLGILLEYTKGFPKDFRVLSRTLEKNGLVKIIFNKILDNPQLKILEEAENITWFNPTNDTATVYLKDLEFDSLRFEISDNNNVLDTTILKKSRNAKIEKELELNFNTSNKVDKINHIKITTSLPLDTFNRGSIELLEDSIPKTNLQIEKIVSNQKTALSIKTNWKPKKDYILTIKEGGLKTKFDDTNKEKTINFTLDETENYGDINFEFKGLDEKEQYILEIIDEQKEKIFQSSIMDPSHKETLKNFPGGKYSIRIIYDSNKNGRWDPGDVYTKKQAEKIWYLNRTFTIRPNWEQNEVIEVK